jgi:hypothetical protein
VRDKKKIVKIRRSIIKLRKGSKGMGIRFEIRYKMTPIHSKIVTLLELFLCKKIEMIAADPVKTKNRFDKKCRGGFRVLAIENI